MRRNNISVKYIDTRDLNNLDFINRDEAIYEFFSEVKGSEYNNNKVLITGTLGLWNGRKEIVPTVSENLISAINKCISKCDDFVLMQEGNDIFLIGFHHDGRNVFKLNLLNNKGSNAKSGADLTKPCYQKAIRNYLIY